MDSQFWIKAWNENNIGFHQEAYHEKLTQYFPSLNPKEGQNVLVPLCGKSKDLLWLQSLKLHVHGIELHDHAVESFFVENALSPVKRTEDQNFGHYSYQNIIVSCGDFFKFNGKDSFDFVYDRAALVALPLAMRKTYVQVIKRSLKNGGKCLLIVYEYDQSKLQGPPFSVNDREIHELYDEQFTIERLESNTPKKEGPRLLSVEGLKQNVYLLQKNRSL